MRIQWQPSSLSISSVLGLSAEVWPHCRSPCLLPGSQLWCPGRHDYLFQHLQWASAAVGSFLSPHSTPSDGESLSLLQPEDPTEFCLYALSCAVTTSPSFLYLSRGPWSVSRIATTRFFPFSLCVNILNHTLVEKGRFQRELETQFLLRRNWNQVKRTCYKSGVKTRFLV